MPATHHPDDAPGGSRSCRALLLLLLLLPAACADDSHRNLAAGSSCQTVCACKWKGGKQTVECIERSLITIPPAIDANTQVLDMSGNNLQILQPDLFVRAGLVNLQRLYLRNCRVGQIDVDALRGLTNLIELDLSHNLLTAVPAPAVLAHVASLRELTLASNPIQKVEALAFNATHSLTKLDLSHCDIANIAPDAFRQLDSLHALKLNGNRLAELRPRTIETLSRLHGVELHDNPWLCDCRLRAAKIWLQARNVPYPVAPVCAGGPERLMDRTFAELQVEDFACRPEIRPVARYVEATTGDNATIVCRTAAVPAATVSWYWNGRLLLNGTAFSSYQQLWLFEEGEFEKRSRLVLTNAQEGDSGEFYCVADNRAGAAEANFTLHVAMRAAGMAALGNRQIVGITAMLALLVVLAMLCMVAVMVRYRRSPYAESKTPGRHGGGAGAAGSNLGGCSPTTNGLVVGGGVIQMNGKCATGAQGSGQQHTGTDAMGATTDRHQQQLHQHQQMVNLHGLNAAAAAAAAVSANPLQKPPRLTDLTTSTPPTMGSPFAAASSVRPALMYISPTGSQSGNNPDLIISSTQTTQRISAVDELTQLSQVDAMLTAAESAMRGDRPGSGAYSRAGGCDSLYPSGLWPPTDGEETLQQQQQHSRQLQQQHNQMTLLRRAASTTLSTTTSNGGGGGVVGGSAATLHQTSQRTHAVNMDDETSSAEFMCRTFPRSGIIASHQFGGGVSLLTASSEQHNGGHHATSAAAVAGGYPADYGLPLVHGAEHLRSSRDVLPPPGMPSNAKTLRVWQRGGVPVLPPVTALKRALTSSRNSPDEGYQEGCGTDV